MHTKYVLCCRLRFARHVPLSVIFAIHLFVELTVPLRSPRPRPERGRTRVLRSNERRCCSHASQHRSAVPEPGSEGGTVASFSSSPFSLPSSRSRLSSPLPPLPLPRRCTGADLGALVVSVSDGEAFENDVQGKSGTRKALFEHAQDAITGAFVRSSMTVGTGSTSKVTTSRKRSAEVAKRAAKRRAVASFRNARGVDSVLGGWREVVDGLLKGDQARNISEQEEHAWEENGQGMVEEFVLLILNARVGEKTRVSLKKGKRLQEPAYFPPPPRSASVFPSASLLPRPPSSSSFPLSLFLSPPRLSLSP